MLVVGSLALHLIVLLHDSIEFILKFVDFALVLVLDLEVLHLSLHIVSVLSKLILLLNTLNKIIKVTLQSNDLLVDILGKFVLLSILKNNVFQLDIEFLNPAHHLSGLLLDGLNFQQNGLDFIVLHLQAANDLPDSLSVLVPIDVFRHRVPLLLHELKHFLFMLNIGNSLLEFFLQVLDLLLLVFVLDTLVTDLLLGFENLIGNGFLVFLPFVLKLLQFLVDGANFVLEDVQILALQLFNFFADFLLFFEFSFLLFQRAGKFGFFFFKSRFGIRIVLSSGL